MLAHSEEELFCLGRESSSSRRLFLAGIRFLFYIYTGQLRVNHDTSAIFTDNHLLAQTDVQLSLGRDFVEATTASISLHVDDAQAIA